MSSRKPPAGTSRGPRDDRGVIASRIVAAARQSFAERGWAGTTLRAVARDAGVDPALVHYYFDGKQDLLDACLQPPDGFLERIAAAQAAPMRSRGATLVNVLLDTWEDESSAEILRSMVNAAAHEAVARERVQAMLTEGMIGAVAHHLDAADRLERAGLVASQMVGLAMLRYVWKVEPLASMGRDDLVRTIGPTIQRYLNGRLA